ncbi:MauE/DoxX family redox-associated membrane protein [Nonomuraea sp. NPDC049400]|uniref:MauE/DoxX family redox-associated membrane protein n=1 Tax=Nonomuraea sp. NPDC049400 TaxID=3364352 RepID=UPI00379734D6
MDYLAIACRCLIGLIFAISALSKIRGRQAYQEFARTTTTLLPRHGRKLALPALAAEFAVPVLLALPATTLAGFGLAATLLTAFAVAIAAALRRGVRTSCRCFGASTTPLGTQHVIRNAALIAVSATGAALGPGDPAHPGGIAVAAVAAVVLATLVTRLDDLIDLFAPTTATGRPSR